MNKHRFFCAVTALSLGIVSAFCVSPAYSQNYQEKLQKKQALASLLPEDMLKLSDEELTAKLEEVFDPEQKRDPAAILNAVSEEKQYRLARWFLERYADKLDDEAYSSALRTYASLLPFAAGKFQTREEQTQLVAATEKAIDKALEDRPDSWRVRLAAAVSVRYLPKGFLPSQDGGGQRCFVNSPQYAFWDVMFSESGDELSNKAPGSTLKEAFSKLSQEDAKIKSQLRYSFSRDRIRIMQILDKTLPQVMDEFMKEGTSVNARIEYFERYASALAEPVRGYQPIHSRLLGQKGQEVPNPFDALTNLDDELPEYEDSIPQQYAIMRDVDGARYSSSTEFPQTSGYALPGDFYSASNDGERYKYLRFMFQARYQFDNVKEPWQALVGFAYYSQKIFGLKKTLSESLEIQKYLSSKKQRNIESGAEPNAPDRPSEVAKIADILSGLAAMPDNVTLYIAPNVNGKGGFDKTAEAFQRKELKGLANYIELFNRSLELHESYAALSGLATEYQLRGQYDKAKEYWARAKNLIDDQYIAYGERDRHNGDFGRINDFRKFENVKPCREREIARFIDLNTGKPLPYAARDVNIRYARSYTQGNKGVLYVETKNADKIDFTARKIDLSQELLHKHTQDPSNNRFSLRETVVNDAKQSLLKFADGEPIVWTEDFSAEHSKYVELPFNEAGAYFVETSINGTKPRGAGKTALVFMQDELIVNQDGVISVVGAADGKPSVGKTVEYYISNNLKGGDSLELVKTNEFGVVDVTSFSHKASSGRPILLVAQPNDPNKADVGVSVYDSRSSHYHGRSFSGNAIENYRAKEGLYLATARPIYLPGDEVEYLGFAVRDAVYTYSLIPGEAAVSIRRAKPGEFDGENNTELDSPQALFGPDRPNANDADKKKSQDPEPEVLFEQTVKFNSDGCFNGGFSIPKDWEPGVYVVEIIAKTGSLGSTSPGGPKRSKTRFYIGSKDAGLETRTQERRQEYAVKSAIYHYDNADQTDPKDDLVTLEFSKPSYVIGEEAEVTIRSSFPDLAVGVYRIGQHNQLRQYRAEDYRAVQLENGEGKYRFNVGPRTRGVETVAVRAVHDGTLQTIYYALETRDRGVKLVVPNEVKPGETFQVQAELSGINDFSHFSGMAAVALYDAKLGEPSTKFTEYETARYGHTCRLCRIDMPKQPVFDASSLKAPLDQASSAPKSEAILDDFIWNEISLPIQPSFNSSEQGLAPRAEPIPLPVETRIPESASFESQFVSKFVEDKVKIVDFELTAPKTPGVWKVVLWGVPENGGAFCQEAEIVVKE